MSESKGMNMLVNVPDAIGQDTLSYDLTIPKGKDVLYVKIKMSGYESVIKRFY